MILRTFKCTRKCSGQCRVFFPARGFTLLELLISLSIFAMISAMAYGGLNQVLLARTQTEAQARQLTEIQRAFTFMGRDIEQTVPREIRDAYGEPQPALVGNMYGDFLLELTHTGWSNPAANPRSSLQRIAYTVRDEKLIRILWYMLDRAQDSTPFESVLMSDVKQLEFRYMDGKKKWQTSWPDTSTGTDASRAPPRAVEVSIETTTFGNVTRLFRVPG